MWEVQPVQRASTVKCLPGPLVNISVLQSQVVIYTCCGEVFFFFLVSSIKPQALYTISTVRVCLWRLQLQVRRLPERRAVNKSWIVRDRGVQDPR